MKRLTSVTLFIIVGAMSGSYASGTPTVLSPEGTIRSNQPTFSWTAVAGAKTYGVYARDATGELKVWNVVRASTAGCASGSGTCTYMHPGAMFAEGSGGFWKVMTTDDGYGPESNMLSFTVNSGTTPDEIVLKSPQDGKIIDTSTTTFSWDVLKGEVPDNVKSWSYTIKIIDTTTNETIAFQGLSPSNNCNNGECSYSKPLVDSNYKWQVGIYESYDDGSYAYLLNTDYSDFTVDAGRVESDLTIIPESKGNWDGASLDDVKTLAVYAGKILLLRFPGIKLDPVILRNRTSNGPVILHKRGDNNEYIVDLNVGGNIWDQFTYQFSHELTHAIGNYGNTPRDANQWFEEVFSEAASLLTLKDMAEVWKIAPAFPGTENYASNFEKYYLVVINRETRQLQQGETLADWYLREAEVLRAASKSSFDEAMREKIGVVANKIFEFFNESPDRWSSIRYLNIGDIGADITLEEYLEIWQNQLPNDMKYIAETISTWFGY